MSSHWEKHSEIWYQQWKNHGVITSGLDSIVSQPSTVRIEPWSASPKTIGAILDSTDSDFTIGLVSTKNLQDLLLHHSFDILDIAGWCMEVYLKIFKGHIHPIRTCSQLVNSRGGSSLFAIPRLTNSCHPARRRPQRNFCNKNDDRWSESI